MFKTISNIFQVILFFVDLWKEKDKQKAQEKSILAKEVVDAFKEIDPDTRVSKLNNVVNKLRK